MKELIVLSEKEQPYRLVKAPYLPTRLLGLEASCTFDKFRDLVSKKYTAPSWSWAHHPLQVSWILSGDEHPTSELVHRETEVISEKHNLMDGIQSEGYF